MTAEVSARLAHAFIDTFNSGASTEGIYTEGATLWNNITETEQTHDSGSGTGRTLKELFPDLRFEDVAVHAWEDGFVVQYTILATLADGGEMRAPACGVGEVDRERIARFQEYVDSGQVAALGEALAAVMTDG